MFLLLEPLRFICGELSWKPKSAKYIHDIFSWSPELKLEAYYVFKEYAKNLSEDYLNKEFWYLFENKYYSYLFNKNEKESDKK